ncbi:MAG: ExeA family protein [Pseudomonadota bacterium]
MYLAHFGLSEPPFRITPVTEFFFSGANRQEILDALIYSINEVEGITKVSGEVGSGKTMLCQMLLQKLPQHFEVIYLANPSMSREEMLYAIADGLKLSIDNERVGLILKNIENTLLEKAKQGKRVVVLVDEAHAMPVDTLEALRLLYNLQIGNSKLLQIALFGQPELDSKLEQPNMRQLKDRIVHHFHIQPLSDNIIENYLMFRMRAAGYHGPNIFSADALKLIASASKGLMRRANVIADKALLAAFIEGAHNIDVQHIKKAIRDSEVVTPPPAGKLKKMWLSVATATLLLLGASAWWLQKQAENRAPSAPVVLSTDTPATGPTTGNLTLPAETPAVATTQPVAPVEHPLAANAAAHTNPSLFEQRLAAGKQLLAQNHTGASLQLFYSTDIQANRMEGFLRRAQQLGVLADVYLVPEKFGNKDGLRALYGIYPSAEAARRAVKNLPKRYQQAFTPTPYALY